MKLFNSRSIRLFATAMLVAANAVVANAQISYTQNGLSLQGAPAHKHLSLTIDKWAGMYWTCNNHNFFQLDLSPANPRLAGTGDQVVFYNTDTNKFNSIQVANVYNYSDARAKKNIRTLSSGLDAVLALRPVSYNWKDNVSEDNPVIHKSKAMPGAARDSVFAASGPSSDHALQYGFLAQEVEQVIPDAVITDENGMKLVNYTAIIPMLVQAVQDLKATVEVQAQQLEAMNQTSVMSKTVTAKYSIVGVTPNPTNGSTTVSTDLNGKTVGQVVISDLQGTREKTATVSGQQSVATLNIGDLKPGMYIVSLFAEGKLQDSQRLIKE